MQVRSKPVERAAWAVLAVAVIGILMPLVAQAVHFVGQSPAFV